MKLITLVVVVCILGTYACSKNNELPVDSIPIKLKVGEGFSYPVYGIPIEDAISINSHPAKYETSDITIDSDANTTNYLFTPLVGQTGRYRADILIEISPGGFTYTSSSITRFEIIID